MTAVSLHPPPRHPLARQPRLNGRAAAGTGGGGGPVAAAPPCFSSRAVSRLPSFSLLFSSYRLQAAPSLLSFAPRLSPQFYSLPHVTHRVKLHLRRVTHITHTRSLRLSQPRRQAGSSGRLRGRERSQPGSKRRRACLGSPPPPPRARPLPPLCARKEPNGPHGNARRG